METWERKFDSLLAECVFGNGDDTELKSFIKQERSNLLEELKAEVEELRPYPFKPCPHCGSKLEFGSSQEMRFGCYNKECPRVKANNYFFVDLYKSYESVERISQTLDQVIELINKKV